MVTAEVRDKKRSDDRAMAICDARRRHAMFSYSEPIHYSVPYITLVLPYRDETRKALQQYLSYQILLSSVLYYQYTVVQNRFNTVQNFAVLYLNWLYNYKY